MSALFLDLIIAMVLIIGLTAAASIMLDRG